MGKDLYNRIESQQQTVSDNGGNSHISYGTTIKGDIICDSDIRIDGNVEGTIVSRGRITMGEKSEMKGDIEGSTVDFSGTIKGNMTVRDILSLKNTSRVNGNIHTRKIQIELGAQFNGSCRMLKPVTATPERPVPPAPSASPVRSAASVRPVQVAPADPEPDLFHRSDGE